MGHRHRCRKPDSHEYTQLQRVAHYFVQVALPETGGRFGLAREMVINLPQTKQLKVIDHKGRCYYEPPAQQLNCCQKNLRRRIGHIP